MLEFNLSGNLGKHPRVVGDMVRSTICCNTPINGVPATEPVWVDLEAPAIERLGERLLELYKGDGVLVRGIMRVNYYQHGGKEKQGWIMAINMLNVLFKI